MINAARYSTIFRIVIAGVLTGFCNMPLMAADYFVSSKGSDSFNGLASVLASREGSIGPFATLEPLSKLNLQHGDRIFLACGEQFQGPVRLALQSTLPGTLSITRYGDCPASERPVVDGRILIEAFTGSGQQLIRQKKTVVQVFKGDVPLPRARFPKNAYLIFPSNTVNAVDRIPKDLSLNGKDLSGAVLHARTQEWLIEERKVKNAENQLDSPLQYPLRPKAGAYFTGKAWMLGEDEGWAFDDAAQTLHVRNKSEKPVSVAYAGALLQIEGRGSVSVSGIAFHAAGGDGINLKLDGDVNINDVAIKHASGNGITIAGSSYAQITNSRIEDTAQDGIFFAEVKKAVVRRNKIANAGLYLGPSVSLAAINAHRTDSATIEENEVIRSAYIGIRFAGDAQIRSNVVDSACLYLADCGAIYTWRRGVNDVRPSVEISGNSVIDVKGDTSVKFGVFDYFSGIYLDEWTRATSVIGNVIVNAEQGIYLHNARGNVVEGNYILGARGDALREKDDASILVGQIPMHQEVPNKLANNTILPLAAAWVHQWLGSPNTNATAKIRVVTGLQGLGLTLSPASIPSQCRTVLLGGTKTNLATIAVQVFTCDNE